MTMTPSPEKLPEPLEVLESMRAEMAASYSIDALVVEQKDDYLRALDKAIASLRAEAAPPDDLEECRRHSCKRKAALLKAEAAPLAEGRVSVPDGFALGETIYTPPGEEVRFCYTRGQPDNANAWRLGEACRHAAEASAGDYIDRGLALLKMLEERGYGVFRFVKDLATPTAQRVASWPERFDAATLDSYEGGWNAALDAAIKAVPSLPSPAAQRVAAGDEWRCFHCDERFTDSEAAAVHFGTHEHQRPACLIDAAEYRRMEAKEARYAEEDADCHRALYRQQSEHQVALRRAEEAGYAKGLSDAAKHPEDAALAASPTRGAVGEVGQGWAGPVRCVQWYGHAPAPGTKLYTHPAAQADAREELDAVKAVSEQFERCASKLVPAEYASGYREALAHVAAALAAPVAVGGG